MSDKPETVDLAYIGRLVAAFEATHLILERACRIGRKAGRSGRNSRRSG